MNQAAGTAKARVSVLAALAGLAIIACVDIVAGGRVVLLPLLAAPPLIAAIGAGPREVGLVAALCILVGLPLGDIDNIFGTTRHAVALLSTAAAGTLAAVIAHERGAMAGLVSAELRMEAIVANLGEAVSAVTPDGRFVFANEAAAELGGFPSTRRLLDALPEELLHRFVLLDEHGEPVDPQQQPLLAALRGERPAPLLVQLVEPDTGDSRWIITRAVPVRDDAGRLSLVVSVIEDVTAVKREEERQRLLSTASKLLSSSLDVASTVEKAAWAVVPEFADWVRVDLPDERGILREVAVAHRDVHKVELLREWRRDYPPDPADTRGPFEALRSRRSIPWWTVDDVDVQQYARDERHAALMREIDTRSVLNVPMLAGDHAVGVLQLATTGESGRLLTARDLTLAEELAHRAAIAVENARLHEARTHIATTLQRSLLPPRLPAVPGLAVAARFRAASGGVSEVGGDFYDVFECRGGWMAVMGDVTGKGPGAAAITSLARYTLRTAARYEQEPQDVVQRLNAALVTDADRRQICTAVVVVIRPGAEGPHLRVVCAGHPPPLLLRADGEVVPIGRAGTLLGAFPEGRWHEDDVTLNDGEALLLYTDGVTDARGPDGRFGQERLEALLRGRQGMDPDSIAAHVDEALQAFGEQRDDVALLVLRADRKAATDAAADGFVRNVRHARASDG